VDGAAEAGGVACATAAGAGVVAGTASSGILRVRLERLREAPTPLLESRVAPVGSGVSMSGMAGGPSPTPSASIGEADGCPGELDGTAGGGPEDAARGRGGAGGADSGPRVLGAPALLDATGVKSGLLDVLPSALCAGDAPARCVNPIAELNASGDGGASAEGDMLVASSPGGEAAP
jgi:hypothetical protein